MPVHNITGVWKWKSMTLRAWGLQWESTRLLRSNLPSFNLSASQRKGKAKLPLLNTAREQTTAKDSRAEEEEKNGHAGDGGAPTSPSAVCGIWGSNPSNVGVGTSLPR